MSSTPGTVATAFDRRANAIGFLRLSMALFVIISHSCALGGFAYQPGQSRNTLGLLGVEGFFAMSGFLISASAQQAPTMGRFLWHRMLRIYPGFWVSMVVIAVVFAPLSTLIGGGHVSWGSAALYPLRNMSLHMAQPGIEGTLHQPVLAIGNIWSGATYTLEIEFTCYVTVACLVKLRALRPSVVLALTCLAELWLLSGGHGTPLGADDDRWSRFAVSFLAGASLYLWREKVPMSWASGLGVTMLVLGSFVTVGFTVVGILGFAYTVIWLSTILLLRRIGARGADQRWAWPDLSYGLYLYAWPVQQILALAGAPRHGYPVYLGAVIVVTTIVAAASWYAVERPALRLKDLARRRTEPVDPTPASVGVA